MIVLPVKEQGTCSGRHFDRFGSRSGGMRWYYRWKMRCNLLIEPPKVTVSSLYDPFFMFSTNRDEIIVCRKTSLALHLRRNVWWVVFDQCKAIALNRIKGSVVAGRPLTLREIHQRSIFIRCFVPSRFRHLRKFFFNFLCLYVLVLITNITIETMRLSDQRLLTMEFAGNR